MRLSHLPEKPNRQHAAKAEPFAAVFLDYSKCYDRVNLTLLEESVESAGFPSAALRLAIDMYRGRRRILVNGAVSSPVEASSGIPAGCGLAVDLLHAFLQHQINRSELKVLVRKYVDDMVSSAAGKGCLCSSRSLPCCPYWKPPACASTRPNVSL
eukprot:6477839-Amphidinium_carterae.1